MKNSFCVWNDFCVSHLQTTTQCPNIIKVFFAKAIFLLHCYSQGRLSNSNRVQYYFWGPNANYNSVHTLSFLIMLSGKERECALTMLSRVGERVNTVL